MNWNIYSRPAQVSPHSVSCGSGLSVPGSGSSVQRSAPERISETEPAWTPEPEVWPRAEQQVMRKNSTLMNESDWIIGRPHMLTYLASLTACGKFGSVKEWEEIFTFPFGDIINIEVWTHTHKRTHTPFQFFPPVALWALTAWQRHLTPHYKMTRRHYLPHSHH